VGGRQAISAAVVAVVSGWEGIEPEGGYGLFVDLVQTHNMDAILTNNISDFIK